MKPINLKLHDFSCLLFLIILLAYSSSLIAKNSDCWVDLFQEAPYKGEYFRITEPSQLNNLLNIKGENWDKAIASIVGGSKANLIVFENKNFKLTLTEMVNYPVLMKSPGTSRQDIVKESEIIFRPDLKVHSFGDCHFYYKIRSLKAKCV